MEIFIRNVDELSHDPENVRKHNEKNISAIKGSLKIHGQQKPIVIDKNDIVIAGNGTLRAAIELGWDTIKCVITDLDGLDKKSFAIADNRTSELAEWDDDGLNALLEKLENENYNIEEIGFDIKIESFDDKNNVKDDMIEYMIVVEAIDERQQEEIYKKLVEEGYKCKLM